MGCCESIDYNAAAAQTYVPDIPGWDGVGIATLPMQVSFDIQGGWGSVTASIQPLFNTIVASEVAGRGFGLAAVFLPVVNQGEHKGQPMDMQAAGFMSATARAMCIFQKDLHYGDFPLETSFLQSNMATKVQIWSAGVQVSGYEGLYSQLAAAGGAGFPLGAVIDEPNVRMNGFRTTVSTVHLICQRPQGAPPQPPAQYQVANCQINIAGGFTSMTASMPTLPQTLHGFCSQGYKIASVYNPPTVQQVGMMSASSQCHLVFQKTACNYFVTVCDMPFKVTGGFSGRVVDHNQYLSIVTSHGNKGWELAGLIDMPDGRQQGLMSMVSTIKLIFQAPALAGPGGFLDPNAQLQQARQMQAQQQAQMPPGEAVPQGGAMPPQGPPPGYAAPSAVAPQPGYAPPQAGYAPPPTGYAPPPQGPPPVGAPQPGYAPPQGYAPPPQGPPAVQ